MNQKISDFGLARSFGGNETEANTKRVVGTYGYMSQEYAIDGLFSIKSDVFSFGILVLEIVSGKKNRSSYHLGHSLNLLGHVRVIRLEVILYGCVPIRVKDPSFLNSLRLLFRNTHRCWIT
ncbi:hypothetical protein CsSME_00018458 [Camellia sinensis var. sinensis]